MANLLRAAFLTIVAAAFLQGCSLDLPSPTAWLGSDDDTKTEDGEFPNLSDVPDRPEELSSQAEKRKSAENLAADGRNANYTSETLRGDNFTPAFAPQPASNVLEGATEASPQADEPDSDETDDQRSELPAASKNAALAPAPPAQPVVPVRIEEVPAQVGPVPAQQMNKPANAAEAAPAAKLGTAAPQHTPRTVTLAGGTYASNFAESGRDEDELRNQKASFAQTSWTEEADVPRSLTQARIDLLIDDVGSQSRNDVFKNQLAGSAVITNAPNQLAFAPADGPSRFKSNTGTLVASAAAVQGNRSPALSRRSDRRYTATLLEERVRAGQQLAVAQSGPVSPSDRETIMLARTNASGFTLSAADTLDASSAMAASVARADSEAAQDRRESVPPFKTLTFARAAAPDLSEVDVAARMADAVKEPAPAPTLQVAKAEPQPVEPTPAIADQPEVTPVENMEEEAQPPIVTLFFAKGAVQIEESDEPNLERIADVQQQKGGAVRVVTHVPSLPDGEEQGSQLSLQASLERARAVSRRMMKLGVHPTAVVVETHFDKEETAERVVQNANSDLRVEVFLE